MEIERLSRLYDFELNKQTKYEEKMLSLKQMAEEKQIESAAIKYEFRKIQEAKENLAAENAYLKSLLTNSTSQSQKTTNASNTNVSLSSSPKSNYNSPRMANHLTGTNLAVSSTSSLCSAGSISLINTSVSNLANITGSLQVQGMRLV